MFKQHARRLYTWKSRIKLLETRSIISYVGPSPTGLLKISIKRVTTIPGVDYGTDHNLFIAIVQDKAQTN